MPDAVKKRDDEMMYAGAGSRPIPDPTELTATLVERATGALKELVITRLEDNREMLESRLNGMDEAVKLLQTILDRRPAEINERVGHAEALVLQQFNTVLERFNTVDQKFSGIMVQFAERDTRSERESRDNKTAIDAALLAQKDAVRLQTEASALATAKSEAATMKQTDQLVSQLQTSTKALDDKITDLKDRQQALLTAETRALMAEITNLKDQQALMQTTLAGMQANGLGRTEQATQSHQGNAWILSLALAATTLISFALLIAEKVVR